MVLFLFYEFFLWICVATCVHYHVKSEYTLSTLIVFYFIVLRLLKSLQFLLINFSLIFSFFHQNNFVANSLCLLLFKAPPSFVNWIPSHLCKFLCLFFLSAILFLQQTYQIISPILKNKQTNNFPDVTPFSLFLQTPKILERVVQTRQTHFLSNQVFTHSPPQTVLVKVTVTVMVSNSMVTLIFIFLAAFDILAIPFFFRILHLPSRKSLSWVFSYFIGCSPLCLSLLVFLISKFWSIPVCRS